jgi:anti-anti-sigma regulatory factor
MQADAILNTIDLGASLTVERAAPLRDEIAEALAGGEAVRIGFAAVEELDLSCLQVLYSALHSAKAAGRELHFYGPLSPHVASRLKACGILADASRRSEDLESALGLLS